MYSYIKYFHRLRQRELNCLVLSAYLRTQI